MDVKIIVDGEEVMINDFVNRILAGVFVGAVTALRDITKDWKEVKIEIKR